MIMTIVSRLAIFSCLSAPSSSSTHPHSPPSLPPWKTSAKADVSYLSLYPSWPLTTPSSHLSFSFSFLFFGSFTIWRRFFPPFLQFQCCSCIHGWTENVPPLKQNKTKKKLGPNCSTRNVFLLLICVSIYLFVWNNQLQYLVMGMSNVLFVCMICHNCFLTSLSPAMFSGCISPCIFIFRPEPEHKTWALSPHVLDR